MDERQASQLAAELGLSAEQVREAEAQLTPGVLSALAGAMIRYEDALFELSQ